MNIKTIRISTILLIIFLFTPITDYALSCVIDQDNDGIPNVVETKLGLDWENPDDALYDMDDDGFPNIFEYQQATKINKAKSHPPLYMRLHLREFRETLLPFQLMLVNTNGDKKDPADWTIHINERMERSRYRYKYLDSTMVLDKTRYTITKIDARHEEKRQGGSLVKIDTSKVYLKSKDGKYTITMQVDKPIYSPRPKAVIEDLGSGKMYHVGEGDTISMYMRTKAAVSKKTGRKLKRRITKYKVVKVDRQKKQVIIEDKKRKKKYTLTAKAFMPRPIKAVIKPKLTKPTVIQTAELKPTRLGQTQNQTQAQDNVSLTLTGMICHKFTAQKGLISYPSVCANVDEDWRSGRSEVVFVKKLNPKQLVVHAVFPKSLAMPKNLNKTINLQGYFQRIKVEEPKRLHKRINNYKYFVVTSWEYQK